MLVFCTVIIFFRTLFGRKLWNNPLSNVIGQWKVISYIPEDNIWDINTEIVENIILFIPFVILLLWNYQEKICGTRISFGKMLWKSSYIVFLTSLTIESLQMFLHVGTWQLSDLFFNTVGGTIGGLLYYIACKIHLRRKK